MEVQSIYYNVKVIRSLVILLCMVSLNGLTPAICQETVVSGRITDADSGDPLPFVSVVFQNTYTGVTSDFDGYFTLKTNQKADSLEASYIGYFKKAKAINHGKTQEINFQLKPNVVSLSEVVIVAGENPAWEIIRNAVKNKQKNDKKSLSAYEYESYNKLEVDVDKMSDKLRNQKAMKKISMVLDSIDQIAGEDGTPVLPIFISESLSKFYYRQNPDLQREFILNTKIKGVGVQDGSIISQFIGSSFQEYNFYENWLTIVGKEFVSPIADGWKMYYDYDLVDSLFIGEHYCYKIDVYPNRPQDLAFQGTIWITKNEYALKQIDLTIGKDVNLNFIDKIKVQQELEITKAGAWLPVKARKTFDIGALANETHGFLIKSYTSIEDYSVNAPHPPDFYNIPIEVAENAKTDDEDFWQINRHERLSETEKNVFLMIDTLQKIPMVKSYIDIMNIVVNGYKRIGKVDVGSYLLAYANNNIEGHRFRVGLRTNTSFSRKWVLKGYIAYGTRDEMFKYNASVTRILSRKPWTSVGVSYRKDVEQVGLTPDEFQESSIFYATSNFGNLIRPFIDTEAKVWFQTEIKRGLTNTISFRTKDFNPLFDFYYLNPDGSSESSYESHYRISEIKIGFTFAKNELFVQNDNERISLGNGHRPKVTVNYTYGMNGVIGSDFEYHKLDLKIRQSLKMGLVGRSTYTINAGQVFSPLPYPLLKVHIGNETLFSAANAYNLMNEFEFISDRYASLNYQHHFEGFILNRIPLMKRLKWRLVASANVLFGSMSEKNVALVPEVNPLGEPIPLFDSLSINKPYIELGYGIENIFKIMRVDAFHRITYLDKADVSKFGIKINFQFIL